MKSTRKAYGEALVEIGRKDKNVIVVDADLAHATCTLGFKKVFPNRHINVGIAEQDLVGTSAGIALAGKKVYASSFAMFLAGRAYEQIRNTLAYSNIPVKLCATHSGLSVGEDGPTHQCLEDIALMRVIPNMAVLSPCDEISTKALINLIKDFDKPVYVRLGRSDVESIYQSNENFQIGGSKTFGDGTDAVVFATGATVQIALEAKEILNKKDIEIKVVDIYSIKPIDRDTVISCAKAAKKVITIEDHSIIGGLGSSISDVLIENYPVKVIKIGVEDKFGKSGTANEVLRLYNITAENIVNKIIR